MARFLVAPLATRWLSIILRPKSSRFNWISGLSLSHKLTLPELSSWNLIASRQLSTRTIFQFPELKAEIGFLLRGARSRVARNVISLAKAANWPIWGQQSHKQTNHRVLAANNNWHTLFWPIDTQLNNQIKSNRLYSRSRSSPIKWATFALSISLLLGGSIAIDDHHDDGSIFTQQNYHFRPRAQQETWEARETCTQVAPPFRRIERDIAPLMMTIIEQSKAQTLNRERKSWNATKWLEQNNIVYVWEASKLKHNEQVATPDMI